jgi:hypothetical protein
MAAHTVHTVNEDIVQVLDVVAPEVVLRSSVGRHRDPRRQCRRVAQRLLQAQNTCRSPGEQDRTGAVDAATSRKTTRKMVVVMDAITLLR